MSSIEKPKKKDRSTAPVVALLIGCVVSAYGYSRHDPVFLWMVPLALVAAATLWAYWPRAAERGKPSSGV